MKNDISSDYLPVNPSSLKTDMKIGYDLYLLVKTNYESRYVLYSRADAVFEDNKRGMLWEKNISTLYIKKDDQEKYYEYLKIIFRNL